MRSLKNLLVTGGSGFIGTNFIRHVFSNDGFAGKIINIDKLTYAGNTLNLVDINEKYGGKRYFFERADITDLNISLEVFKRYAIDTVVHFAAETHVDRSISSPTQFIFTNIVGTFNLLEAARIVWKDRKDVLFHHVSTDEVFGSLGGKRRFTECTPYDPRNPYSASKASSDHLVRAYFYTYHLPVTLSNCSNNYGPYQFPEKLIPVMIESMLAGKPLPIYGDGKNIRDWLYVEDHANAIWHILKRGDFGEKYVVGGENQWENIKLVNRLCELVSEETGLLEPSLKGLISFVKDRPGHDLRYSIDCKKIKKGLGWKRTVILDDGLRRTVKWYLENRKWIETVINDQDCQRN
ncbi:MAG: dTDP-glucose 4,6-dehydratase [Flavobacteriaceae bacterium]|nr:dTDP-glucose 4,6-dehydratase [Flavobacteriaceae bacterium]